MKEIKACIITAVSALMSFLGVLGVPVLTLVACNVIDYVTGMITSLTAPTVGTFIYDYQNGVAGYNTSPTRGADTFHPFKSAIVFGNAYYGAPTTLSIQIPFGLKEIYIHVTQSMNKGTYYTYIPSGAPFMSFTMPYVKNTIDAYPWYSQNRVYKIILNGQAGTLYFTPSSGVVGDMYNLAFTYYY